MKGNTAIIAGVAVGALLLAAVAYLLGIAPRLARAADADEQRVAAQDQNQILQAQLNALIEQDALIPEYQEQIRAIREDLRPEFDRTRVRDAIDVAAANNSLVIGSETIGEPEVLVPSLIFGPAAERVGVTAQGDGLVFSGVVYTSVGLEVAGTTDQIRGFIEDLQYGDHEYFAMADVQIEAAWEAQGIADVSLRAGDVIADIGFQVFTLDFGDPDATLPDPWIWERAPEIVCQEPEDITDAIEFEQNPPSPEPSPTVSPSAAPAPEPSPTVSPEVELPVCPVNDHNFFAPLG